MADKKLSELLGAVNGRSLKKLESFINSPYHNTNSSITRLFLYIKKKGSYGIEAGKLSNEEIAKTIFGNDKKAARKTVLLLKEFRDIVNSFLINESMNEDPQEKYLKLIRIYKERNMESNYAFLKNKLTSQNGASIANTEVRYVSNMIIQQTDKLSRIGEIIYSDSTELKEFSESIDLFFIYNKLKVYSAMTRHQKETLFSLDYTYRFRKILQSYITDNEQYFRKSHPLLYAYYLVLMMIDETKGDKYFNQLKQYLLSNSRRLPAPVFKDLLKEYKDSCDSKILLAPIKYEREIFFVYDLLDKNNIFVPEAGIEPNDFMDAVTSALALNKEKWAYYFFDKYKDIISSNSEDTIHIVKARLDFHSKNYTEALSELNKISSKQFYFYLRIRMLRIKIYYDLSEIEAVTYILDAVKHYIKRNKKLIGTNYELIYNFISYLNEIIKIRTGKSRENKQGLLRKVNSRQNTASKDWLIEKINELH